MKKHNKIILMVLVVAISLMSLSALVEFAAFSEYYDQAGHDSFFRP